MRIPTRGYRIFAECSLPTATSDAAPTELGAFRGWRSYKDSAPTELVGERVVGHNIELIATVEIIVDSVKKTQNDRS